jgi:hypothetical protein
MYEELEHVIGKRVEILSPYRNRGHWIGNVIQAERESHFGKE